MILRPGHRIVFIGDSITDSGRRSGAAPLGDGYVSMIDSLIKAQYPHLALAIINRGIGGNTVRHLNARWETDLIAERPDWVSLMIGINDVWRHYDAPEQAVPAEEYRSTLNKLLTRMRQQTAAQLIMMTPYMIEPDHEWPMRRQMDQYRHIYTEVAQQFDAVLIDVQQQFDAVLKVTTPSDWANDKIHPNQAGHAIIATAWLRSVGFEWQSPRC